MKVSHHWGSHERVSQPAKVEDALFKTQHEDAAGNWLDVLDEAGLLKTFVSAGEARAGIEAEFPVDAYLTKYGARQNSRVVRIFRDDKEWREG